MRVTGTKILVEEVELDLSDSELKRVVTSGDVPLIDLLHGLRQTFLKRIGVDEDAVINDLGLWEYSYEEGGGSHSWTKTKTEREATNNEKIVMETLDDLKTALTVNKLS